MTVSGRPSTGSRIPLWRERILAAAVTQADETGLGDFSMRKLAQVLGVAPMALYRHVANKDDLLDGMVDLVFSELDPQVNGPDWKSVMRSRAISIRAALDRHPWAIGLMESQPDPGLATLRHHDAVLGTLRRAGFSVEMAAHAYSVMDSYVYGFVMQQHNLPIGGGGDTPAGTRGLLDRIPADEYPYLVELTVEHVMKPGYDYGAEFEYGLDLILDGLERRSRTT